MTIAFPDLSGYQGALSIQRDTVAVVAKATEGTYYKDAAYPHFRDQTLAEGGIFSAYHFLKQEGSAAEQARFCFGYIGSMACMLDVETEGSSHPGMVEILSFINTMKSLGGRVWGVYLPHWYWQQIGSPDLRPIEAAGAVVVSSAYTAYSDTGPGWNAYGNVTPRVWQYTDAQLYSGQRVDFNAFKGSAAELRQLVTGVGAVPPGPPVPPKPTKPQISLANVIASAKVDPGRATGQTSNWTDVIYVEKALNAEFPQLLPAQYVDGSYGDFTVKAYRSWQNKLGFSGADADGLPGRASLTVLGAKYGWDVV